MIEVVEFNDHQRLAAELEGLALDDESKQALIGADDQTLDLVLSSHNICDFMRMVLKLNPGMLGEAFNERYGFVVNYFNARSRKRLAGVLQ